MERKYKKISFLEIVMLFWTASLFAQPPDTLWTRTYGRVVNGDSCHDLGISVQQTMDGGYIILGAYTWLIKTDENGNILWDKLISSGGGYSLQQTRDGGYIITGETRSGDPYKGNLWLVKTDGEGNVLWEKSEGGGHCVDLGCSVQQTRDGGYIVTGTAQPFDNQDLWFLKTDEEGNIVWSRIYGDSGNDAGQSAQQTRDGGYIITGTRTPIGRESPDLWLIKTDENGKMLWDKTFGGEKRDGGFSVQQTRDGGYIVLGKTFSFGAGKKDVWLVKTDENGSEQWNKTFGGSDYDDGYSVQQTRDNGYIIAGIAGPTSDRGCGFWLIKTDEKGNMLWDKVFSPGSGNSVEQTRDGGYIAVGTILNSPLNRDIWLIKVAPETQGITETSNPPIFQSFNLSISPNPIKGIADIRYEIPDKGPVSFQIYDAAGRLVKTLLRAKDLEHRAKSIVWDGRDDAGKILPAGIYFVKLKTENSLLTKKVILMR